MRVTTQMIAQQEARNGISVQKTSLLDVMNSKRSASTSLFDGLNSTPSVSNASSVLEKNNYTKLETAAETLKKTADKLADTSKDSLFAKATESDDTKEITDEISKMVEEYNATLKQLQKTGGTMNNFYEQQLKQIPAESKDILKSIGITQNTDGTLGVDNTVLQKATLDSLQKAVGTGTELASKIGYASAHIADNASANLVSASSQYTANGASYLGDFEASKYNFLG